MDKPALSELRTYERVHHVEIRMGRPTTKARELNVYKRASDNTLWWVNSFVDGTDADIRQVIEVIAGQEYREVPPE